MGLSLGEIIVVLIVMLLVTKPSDVPIILKKLRYWQLYLRSWQKQISSSLEEILNETDQNIINADDKQKKALIYGVEETRLSALSDTLEDQAQQLNFYLEKIITTGAKYNGAYDLPIVKAYYHKLLISQKSKQLKGADSGIKDQSHSD